MSKILPILMLVIVGHSFSFSPLLHAGIPSISVNDFIGPTIEHRVVTDFDGFNFEQFLPDTRIVSTGFAFRVQEANTLVESAVTSLAIQDNRISHADISH